MQFREASQAELDRARAFDARLARERLSRCGRVGAGGELKRQLSLQAYFNVIRDCGHDCPADERERYLADNERLYLDVNSQRTPPGPRNRFGRVKERTAYRRLKNGTVEKTELTGVTR